jgi:hypothetical protein
MKFLHISVSGDKKSGQCLTEVGGTDCKWGWGNLRANDNVLELNHDDGC